LNKHAVIQQYFLAWNKQDKDKLTELFSENCTLKDWDIDVSGRDNVIAANANIWKSVPDIHVLVYKIIIDENAQSGHGQILVVSDNENLSLPVIDVFSFDNDNKIVQVSAYKQQ
jgi:ketosteroid isomerase-like protein